MTGVVGNTAVALKCKKCGSTRVYRSRRENLWERALSPLGLYPYRCHECDLRFLGSSKRTPGKGKPNEAKIKLRHEVRQESRRRRQRQITRMILLYGLALVLFLLFAKYIILKPPSMGE